MIGNMSSRSLLAERAPDRKQPLGIRKHPWQRASQTLCVVHPAMFAGKATHTLPITQTWRPGRLKYSPRGKLQREFVLGASPHDR